MFPFELITFSQFQFCFTFQMQNISNISVKLFAKKMMFVSKFGTCQWKTGSHDKANCQHWFIPQGHIYADYWMNSRRGKDTSIYYLTNKSQWNVYSFLQKFIFLLEKYQFCVLNCLDVTAQRFSKPFLSVKTLLEYCRKGHKNVHW